MIYSKFKQLVFHFIFLPKDQNILIHIQSNLFVQDEDIYTFFEPDLPSGPSAGAVRTNIPKPVNGPASNLATGKCGSGAYCNNPPNHPLSALDGRTVNNGDGNTWWPAMHDRMAVHEGSSVLDLKSDNYFSCAVGRKQSSARYLLGSSADVVSLLKELAALSTPS